MGYSPMAQESTWLFCVDSPVYVRCLQPVLSLTDNSPQGSSTSTSGNDTHINYCSDLVTDMPFVLLSDQKTGAVTAYDSKLQHPCGDSLPTPPCADASAVAPTFSSAANLSLCLCAAPAGALWVGWSSGHIGVYRMQSRADAAAARVGGGRDVRWNVLAFLNAHRAGVHTIVTGPGPWVFSAGDDYRVLQWHAATRQLLRDLTHLCRLADDTQLSPVHMMCMTSGCSSTTKFTQPRGHFTFFFSTERRYLFGVSLGETEEPFSAAAAKEEEEKEEDEDEDGRDVPVRRVLFPRPAVTSAAAVLSGDAAVFCFGSEEGFVAFAPLTVVHNSAGREGMSGAAYLREVAEAAQAAETLHIQGGRIVSITVLAAETDCATDIMSYVLAAASSNNTVTLLMVRVAPVVAGGHITESALLSVLEVESPLVSLAPLFPPMQQRSVVTAMAAFADGTTAALFYFQNGPNSRHAATNDTLRAFVAPARAPRGKSERRETLSRPAAEDANEAEAMDSRALRTRLCSAIASVRQATFVADEAEQTLRSQSQELCRLRSSQDALLTKVQQLAEALNTKTDEVVALQRRTAEENHTQALEQRCRVAEREIVHLNALNKKSATRLSQMEVERDDAREALRQAEVRFQAKIDKLLREKRSLTETVTCLEQEAKRVDIKNGKQSNDLLRALLEEALSTLDPA